MSLPVQIRPARASDIEAIRAIYNDAVVNTNATMRIQPNTFEEQTAWLDEHDGNPYAALVAVAPDDLGVVGWASLSPYIRRPGYNPTAEVSVYVHCDYHGLRVGSRLMSALVVEAYRQNFASLVSLITSDRAASLRLHERAGFVEIGTLRRVGFKFDTWVDVTILQRMLD